MQLPTISVTPLYAFAITCGAILTLALLAALILWRKQIAHAVRAIWMGTFSQVGLFYAGMGVFMLASIVEAGPILDKIVMHGALFGYGGHMLVFAFDMLAAVCLRARLNAKRVYDEHGMRVQMWGIVMPAAVSIAANLAGALQSFQAGEFNHLGWIAWALPFIGAVFPSMIIILSLASDHMLDTTAISNKIDPEEFDKQEKKRVDILKIRLKHEGDLLAEEEKIAAIRTGREQARHKKNTHEWFFMSWLRREKQPVVDIKALIANSEQATSNTLTTAIATLTANMNAAIESMNTQLEQAAHILNEQGSQLAALAQAGSEYREHLNEQREQITALGVQLATTSNTHREQVRAMSDQIRTVTSNSEQATRTVEAFSRTLAEQQARTANTPRTHAHVRPLFASNTQSANSEHPSNTDRTPEQQEGETGEVERVQITEHIAACRARTPGISARAIAREIGCAPSTVTKHLKLMGLDAGDEVGQKQAEEALA